MGEKKEWARGDTFVGRGGGMIVWIVTFVQGDTIFGVAPDGETRTFSAHRIAIPPRLAKKNRYKEIRQLAYRSRSITSQSKN